MVRLFRFVAVLAAVFAVVPGALGALNYGQRKPYCGMALGTGFESWAYRDWRSTSTLKEIRADGGKYVQISAYLKQMGRDSLRTEMVTDDSSLRFIIRKARHQGLKVFLKPVITVEKPGSGYVWRGYIPGKQVWFDKVHTPFILRMARIAREEKVDILSVGSEYVATLSNNAAWLDTIRQVRAEFKGKLTYIANHDSYHKVRFFRQLDFISISAYFRLRDKRAGPYPGLAETRRLYERELRKIVNWRSRSKLMGKKVLFAEFGIQSKGNGIAYYEPWEWTSYAPVSFEDQVKMYEAFFSTFMAKPWNLGVMLWNYEMDPNAGKWEPTLSGYTPQNKPALKVVRKYYRQYCV